MRLRETSLLIFLILISGIGSAGILSLSTDSKEVCDPTCPTIDEDSVSNIHYDQGSNEHSGVRMNFSDGLKENISYRLTLNSWGGSADSQSDRHMNLVKLIDNNGCEIITIGMHEWNKNIVVYDTGACSPSWQNYRSSNVETGLSADTSRDLNLTWENNQWNINIDGWTYSNNNHNSPAKKVLLGISGTGGSRWGSTYGNYDLEDLTTYNDSLCDIRGPRNKCIVNSEHYLKSSNFVVSELFESTENAIFRSPYSKSMIEISKTSKISGIWRGSFNISSHKTIIESGAKFNPKDGIIRLS